jgi:hypothetical protein
MMPGTQLPLVATSRVLCVRRKVILINVLCCISLSLSPRTVVAPGLHYCVVKWIISSEVSILLGFLWKFLYMKWFFLSSYDIYCNHNFNVALLLHLDSYITCKKVHASAYAKSW